MVEPISDADRELVVRLAERAEWLRAPKGPGPAAFDWRGLKRLAELAATGIVAIPHQDARIRSLEAERDALKVLAEEASVWKDKAIRLEAQLRTATDWKSRTVYPSRVLNPSPSDV